jgi:HEAT repeat protein
MVALACQMFAELRDASAVPDLMNLIRRSGKFQRPAEVRLAAVLAVAEIDPSKAPIDVPLGYVNGSRYELRAQAAHALGVIAVGGSSSQAALAYLSKLLNDPNPLVQVAAAGGILRAAAKQE